LFEKFVTYFDDFYEVDGHKKWTIDSYSCEHFKELEEHFHSTKILNKKGTEDVA
jgi:hypothetical protein